MFCVLLAAGAALGCEQIPAGETLWIRLSSPVSTYSAKVGDPVHAVMTQDIVCGTDVLVPMGSTVEGVVRSKKKVGWGVRHETAALELEFNRITVAPGATVEMVAQVEEVENAREQVKNGVIRGVMSSDTFQGRVNSRLIHLPTWNPYSDLGLIVYKATFPIFPEPEIYYPSGTDLKLKTAATVTAPASGIKVASEEEASATSLQDDWVRRAPDRTSTISANNADLVNLVFLGSQQQVEAAFREAGWRTSDPVGGHSVLKNLYALLNNTGYAQQPMKTFLINGKPENMNFQKGLNSYGRRDHLRIWQWTPEGATEPVWITASTHDTAAVLSVKYRSFVHHISPDIDDERAKVIRDLNFSGCVKSLTYVARPHVPTMTQNANGDWMRTDGAIAVVQLQDCNPVVPGLSTTPSTSGFKPGNHAFRYLRKQILTFRNDIWRANIVYGAYDLSRRAIIAMRHQPMPAINEESKPTLAILPGTASPGVP